MTDERRVKHERVIGWLEKQSLDGVVLTRRCNFSWYTCGCRNHVAEACEVGVSSLVVRRDGAAVVANNIEATRLAGEDLPADVPVIDYAWYDPAARRAAFEKALGGGRFAADAPLPGLDLPATDGEFERLRWQLTGAEIARYRQLALDVGKTVEIAARLAQPGMTEWEIAGQLDAGLRALGIVPWVLLIAADERAERYRHPLPTGKIFTRMAMLVATAERGGLIAAVTRLVAAGRVPEELAAKHRAVATVDAALIGATRVGATLGEVFAAGQRAYEQVGYGDEWRRHHQGGSIGYLGREVKAVPGSDVPVLADQAFAWNPSIGGTKCEDTILCRTDGVEILSATGDWPTIQASWDGQTFARPDILTPLP